MSQLTNYIEKELSKGFSKEKIKGKLIDVGYKSSLIEESFKFIDGKKDTIVRKPEISKTLKTNTKKWIFVGLGILAIIIFAFLLLYVSNITKKVEGIKQVQETTEKETQKQGTIRILQITPERDECYYINNREEKSECYISLAITNYSSKYCYELENPGHCLRSMAIDLNNVTYCYGSEKCTAKVAYTHNKKEYCDSEELGDTKHMCYREYATLSNNPNECFQTDVLCFYLLETNEEEKRRLIEEYIIEMDQNSIDNTLPNLAVNYNDQLFCDFVSEDKKEDCINTL